jgi:hypothetical protein
LGLIGLGQAPRGAEQVLGDFIEPLAVIVVGSGAQNCISLDERHFSAKLEPCLEFSGEPAPAADVTGSAAREFSNGLAERHPDAALFLLKAGISSAWRF